MIDKINMSEWLDNNFLWLTEWLTYVVVIDNLEKDKSTATFQTFRVPIVKELPWGAIDAGNIIKGQLINQSTIGLMSLNPPMFPGFLQKAGRMPEKGDMVLYTALKWFKLEYILESNLILAANSTIPKTPVLTTVCAIDYILNR